jgi:hypothetical protein
MMGAAFSSVTAQNVKDVMSARAEYYDGQVELLRGLIETEGVTVENLSKRRQSLLQGLAVDLGRDFSTVANVRLQCVGSPYYQSILNDFVFYLKDVLNALRLYSGAERDHFV